MNYGRYEIETEIGKGAMGVVYKAHDPKLNRQVAIKVLHKCLLNNNEAVQAFLKEATLNASLSHPNILTILDVGEECGEVYIAMELLEGKPLSGLISDLDKGKILSIGMQIADALDYAHKKGVVHRDIKPANIIVRGDGQIKITDFGIAKGIGGDIDELLETQTGVIKGTPAYMSPEQARGDSKKVDGRSDLFSLGIMLYEMSTGKRPFGGDGKNFMVIFGEILTKTPLEPCKVKETVDSEFSTIIMKSLQKEPAKRYQSGNELFQAIRNCNTRDIPLPKPGTSSLTPRIIIGASAVAVAALAAGALFIFSSGKREASEPPPKTMTAAPTASSPAAAPEAGTTLPPVAAPVTTSTPVASPPVVSPQYPHRETTGTSMVKRVKQHPTAASSDETIKKNAATKKSEPVGTVHRSEQSSAPNQTGERESAAVVGGELTSVKYAFLKVTSNPSEADVFINGSFKGKTPLNLRLTLGRYLVRLGRSGYKNVETSVTLDKMSEFPLTKELVAE